MKKIIAFAGSTSKESINKLLVTYATSFLDGVEVIILDLNSFELPIYSIDRETEKGIPENAHKFFALIKSSNGIIISLAEHNGNFTAAFKNLLDWLSRIEAKIWNSTPILLMSTSPGKRGGASVLSIAKNIFPRFGGEITSEFILPEFYENFKEGKITNDEIIHNLKKQVTLFKNKI